MVVGGIPWAAAAVAGKQVGPRILCVLREEERSGQDVSPVEKSKAPTPVRRVSPIPATEALASLRSGPEAALKRP